jgi:hypothetical protein
LGIQKTTVLKQGRYNDGQRHPIDIISKEDFGVKGHSFYNRVVASLAANMKSRIFSP